ncbi:MAG: helix-turn-helix domain-containing protein [Acidocella sp.]|nr:helix-turn-helix domain-containing protein [Acidocella sp.]
MDDRNFVTALARGLDILRCFDRPGMELTVSEIARRTGLNQPTAWRLSHTLVACGFLVQALHGAGLKIGAPALTLGYAAMEGMSFPAVVLPYMQQITHQTKASTTLTVWQAMEMISVQRCDGEVVLLNQPIGGRTLMTSVPSGLAVLAALPAQARDVIRQQLHAHRPASWPRRVDRMARAQQEYDKFGYVIHQAMLEGQYVGVAVPLIFAEGDDIRAWALSAGGLTTRWTNQRLHEVGEELRRVKQFLEPALAAIPPVLAA